ncbi:hypothetical protein [Neobacillus cucumis]|uniref:hypothetical protein n=1 Tax=Neobacillus cucumis TaxID=1740721 RepID=UPI00196488DE|nr:hypothetical protein [Neobacillus cucumis]MBM7652228.1 hypothetical protein [Neobacillus cucumis]
MLDFLIGFVRGMAAMSPIWVVLYFIFTNAGKPNDESISLQKFQPEDEESSLS